MSVATESKSSWVYNGVWGLLTKFFCVPREAPDFPALDHQQIISRRPSPGFLKYLKLKFWAGLVFVLAVSVVPSLALAGNDSDWAWIVTVVEAVLIVPASLFAYLTIHLRFDTMWYVFSDRSMRLRRGIWLIRESTITFENIQNVKVTQGPLQRYFGIADVVVETAGGGGGAKAEQGATLGMHVGLIEGVAEASEIRDSIMSRVRQTKSSGLGDDTTETPNRSQQWSPQHLAVLKEIRDLANRVATQ